MAKDTHAPMMLISIWICTALAMLFLSTRMFLKVRFRKKIGWDDYLLILAFIWLIIYAAALTMAAKYGLGGHRRDFTLDQLLTAQIWLNVANVFIVVSLAVSKASFALTLLRLVSKTWHKACLWFIFVTVILSLFFSALLPFASCKPVAKIWNHGIKGSCWNPFHLFVYSMFAAVYSGFMDLVLAAFPTMIIRELRINKREKIGVCIAMSLGGLAGIAAFVKASYLAPRQAWKDPLYDGVPLLIWAATEDAATIIATSIPYLRLLIKEATSRPRGYQISDDFHLDEIITSKELTSSSGRGNRTLPSNNDSIIEGPNGRIMYRSEVAEIAAGLRPGAMSR